MRATVVFEDDPNELGASSRPAQERIVGVRANGAILVLSNYIATNELASTQIIHQISATSDGVPMIYVEYGTSLTSGTFTVNPNNLNQVILDSDQQDNVCYNIWYRKSV